MGETFCGTPTEQSRTQLYLVTEEVSHLPLPWSLLVCWPSSHPHTGIILQFSHCTAVPWLRCLGWCCMEVSPISAPLLQTPTPTTLSISLRSSLLLPILTIVQNVQFIKWSTKKKSLACVGEDNSWIIHLKKYSAKCPDRYDNSWCSIFKCAPWH